MNRAIAVLISAFVFTIVGLLLGYMIIAHLPPARPDDTPSNSLTVLLIVGMGSTIVGTVLGLIVGVIAAMFWPRADEPDAEDPDATQDFVRK